MRIAKRHFLPLVLKSSLLFEVIYSASITPTISTLPLSEGPPRKGDIIAISIENRSRIKKLIDIIRSNDEETDLRSSSEAELISILNDDDGDTDNIIDEQGNTLLHVACQFGLTHLFNFAIRNKSCLDSCNEENMTPLMVAV
jgi:ankyrin repeat protein